MLRFYDYLFYKAYQFYYKKEGNLSTSRTGGLLIVSAVEAFNLFSISFIICIIINKKIHVNKFYAVIPVLILIIINGIRYNKHEYDYDELQKRWGIEEEKIINKKTGLIIAYIIFSVILFFGLSIYLGTKNW